MDQYRLVARSLREVAAARMAITASYQRLWRVDTEALSDPGGTEERAEQRHDVARRSVGDDCSSHDVR
jgi:hypothetical protein